MKEIWNEYYKLLEEIGKIFEELNIYPLVRGLLAGSRKAYELGVSDVKPKEEYHLYDNYFEGPEKYLKYPFDEFHVPEDLRIKVI